MLKDLFLRAKDWGRAVVHTVPPFSLMRRLTERPPSRDGCVDVDIFATPRDEDDVAFLRRVKELKRLRKCGDEPTTRLVDYFADRFDRLEIRRIVGCPFRTYLERPLVVEQIRNDLASTDQS